jgi:hypothetical protein
VVAFILVGFLSREDITGMIRMAILFEIGQAVKRVQQAQAASPSA